MPQPPTEWPTVKRIVAAALDRPPSERAALITAQVGGDATLRAEVEALIRAADAADGLLAPRVDRWVGIGGPSLSTLGGQRIGRYQLERLIAEGSTAAVYEATQAAPQRRVAVKVLRDALPLIDASRRFEREAAALGRLNHPNVARIYESGRHRTESGIVLPFIAMEYIDGPPITQHVRERGLPTDAIVQLAIQVASAVHAAHQQAIIHRDLKPANVLVAADGAPKVLDFGIARLLDGDARTWRTTAGILLGTPGYMSPEQAAGRLDAIDVRTDVWAIGVLLYEMLTGRLPIDVTGVTLVEALRRIEREEPTPLSRANAPAGHARMAISSDLETVVMTALARDKERRYASALALAEELGRVLRNEPIAARPPSTIYRFRKFARRHRGGLVVTGAFIALALAATGLLVKSYVTASRERDRAASERDRAQTVSALLADLISAGDPNFGDRNAKMVDVLRAAEGRIASAAGGRPDVEADVRSALGQMYFGLGEYDRSHALLARAIELRLTLASGNAIPVLSDRNALATTLRWLGKPGEAETLASQTLQMIRHMQLPNHDVALTAMEILAGCAHDVQNLPEAEERYRNALAACAAHLGEDHRLTLTTLGNYANVLTDLGRYAEAESIARRIIGVHGRGGTLDSLEGLTARKNLAALQLELGRSDDALRELESVAADAAHALGPNHDSTLRFLTDLGEALRRRGETDRALAVARDILDRRTAALGGSHEYTLKDALDLSSALLRAGRHAEAHELAVRSAAEAERALSADHLLTLRLRLSIAGALSGLGRHAEALALYRVTLATLRAQLGDDHPFTLIATNNLGLAYVASGDAAAAVAALEPLLDRVRMLQFVSMEPVVRRNLGSAYRLAGRFDEAESQLVTAYEQSTQRGEAENAKKAAAVLAELFTDRRQPERAAEWAARAAER